MQQVLHAAGATIEPPTASLRPSPRSGEPPSPPMTGAVHSRCPGMSGISDSRLA
jgi:hypothetical protein